MEWVLQSPQIHSTFSNLGFLHTNGYHVNENCNSALETILHNILSEDKYLRSYRRSISFGQNIKKDLIPLLIHAKEDKTIELLIRILVNLTIPIECLLSVHVISKSDLGRHTIFEINNLLTSTKSAFTDYRATKMIIEFLKKNLHVEQKSKLAPDQCMNIGNTLLLLRNILHIPEDSNASSPNYNGSAHTVQNQILWNLFSQSIDKVLIKLMTIPDANKWGVTMVQLIALLYKDQHVVTLHKLLNLWLEASLSDSSEDNESNTSPPDRGSDDSSPMLTSNPTSDSSDTGGSGKSNDEPNSVSNGWDASSMNNASDSGKQSFQMPKQNKHKSDNESMKCDDENSGASNASMESNSAEKSPTREKKTLISENSDCGYGTQKENQESISTSSNEDEIPTKRPVHQKPHNNKQRINGKARTCSTLQERKRKKMVKRGKSNIINVQGLSHKTPTNDDIANVLKEFTVDFLLKGYNSLVQTLHNQILTNVQLEIDTSHFFWLVTYFLKFATQIELDLEHVNSVLSFDIVSFLTAEGVNLCEQFELAIKLDGIDLKPCLRRLHLVVTAIREFVQAIEVYKKLVHIGNDEQNALIRLQMQMCETEELRSLLVLLLRHYNPKYHSKQYLQDLIVTNHILLLFLDSVMKLPDYNGTTNMTDHIKQFATPEIMYQYSLLLEDFISNGEFVNDCVFTLMHHVGGDLDSLTSLYQPNILKTFSSIWKSEFEICDDWSDLIEYVINTFVKKPQTLKCAASLCLVTESFEDEKANSNPGTMPSDAATVKTELIESETLKQSFSPCNRESSRDRWTEDELSALSWNYMQCNTTPDVVGGIIKLLNDEGMNKSRESVVKELFKQSLISKEEFDEFSNVEGQNMKPPLTKKMCDEEITKMCEQLFLDGKAKCLQWVQKVLLDTCYVKIYVKNNETMAQKDCNLSKNDFKILDYESLTYSNTNLPVMSPVSYHSLLHDQSVPLVPWNCEQASLCKDLKFLQLLHKLGFHMPVDTGKVFIRIPNFWSADCLYDIAGKILPIDTAKLKFSVNDILGNSSVCETATQSNLLSTDLTVPTPENFYQIHKQKHLATMVNFTPMPGSSFHQETDKINKESWLELVQKSQEYKLTLNTSLGRENEESALEKSPEKETVCEKKCELPIYAKNEEPLYALPEIDDCNNSVCETASVASDLTRMYVSDEDEKLDVTIRPLIEDPGVRVGQLDKQASVDSDIDKGRRLRVQFSPSF